jgi:hypothetical protein
MVMSEKPPKRRPGRPKDPNSKRSRGESRRGKNTHPLNINLPIRLLFRTFLFAFTQEVPPAISNVVRVALDRYLAEAGKMPATMDNEVILAWYRAYKKDPRNPPNPAKPDEFLPKTDS